MRGKFVQLIFGLGLAVVLLVACSGAPAQPESVLALTPCVLRGGVEAQCGTLTVPEDRAVENGRFIDLNLAVIPATSADPAPDPLFLLAGGPGQAATEAFVPLLSLLEDLNETRDIVLVDQRGTGDSNPLTCANLQDEEVVGEDLADEEVTELIQACAADLAETADLTQYTTDIAMTDLDAVREALGYEQINLYGASYGSRAAQAYARLFPQHVRTLTLDAVVGPDLVLFKQMPRDGQRALEQLYARCEAEDVCQAAFPNLQSEYEALLARLAMPQEITVAHPLSGESITLMLSDERLSQFVFNILYSTDLVSLLPLLIHDAYTTGNFAPLVAQALMVGEGAALNIGLLYAVTCAEDAPLVDLEEARALQSDTDFALRADDFLAICEAFPETAVAPDFRTPLTSEVPALLLSGDADPVTPPRYAETVAAQLSNSRHLVVPHHGHTVITVGCIPQIVADFITSGAVADLDVSCLAGLQPPPFFTTFAGPEP